MFRPVGTLVCLQCQLPLGVGDVRNTQGRVPAVVRVEPVGHIVLVVDSQGPGDRPEPHDLGDRHPKKAMTWFALAWSKVSTFKSTLPPCSKRIV